jgi:hypothetical protein
VEPSWVYGGFLERASPSESMRRIGSVSPTHRLEVEPSWVYGGFLERASPSESMRRIGSVSSKFCHAQAASGTRRARTYHMTLARPTYLLTDK